MGRISHAVRFLSWCLISTAFLVACTEKESAPQPSENKAVPEQTTARDDSLYIENTLKWQTASESKIFGFHVYRGDSADGPFQLLNPKPVSAAGTTDEYQQYEFSDTEAIPGKTYYYYLEKLDYNNRRKRYSPVFPYNTPAS